jgi:ankyrin repeat protein
MWAAYQGHAKCVHVLVRLGASVLLKDGDGKTAGNLAQEMGHEGVMRVLPKASELLYVAAGKGDLKAVLHWLKSGANKEWVNERNGYNALLHAAKKEQADVLRVLTAAGAQVAY